MDESAKEWFNTVVNELYTLDENCAVYEEDYTIDLQGSSRQDDDNAKRPFFDHFAEENLFSKDTYRTFIALLDNYISGTGSQEEVTPEEVRENIDFINAVCETPLMNRAFEALVEAEYFAGEYNDFKRMLYAIWFKMYGRSYDTNRKGIEDSCAFEHTFVGETRGKPIGFHNWLRFYLLEKNGRLDYRGHIRRANRSLMVQVRFNMNDEDKVSSLFIGTSPEFELALYTITALLGKRFQETEFKAPFEIEGEEYNIQVYLKCKWSKKHQSKKYQLESSFPCIDWS